MENNFFVDNDLIIAMKLGDKSRIYNGLVHNGAIYRINAIIQTVKHKILDDDIILKIQDLKEDNIKFIGVYKVSDFAISALVLLGIEEYYGDDEIQYVNVTFWNDKIACVSIEKKSYEYKY